MEPISDILKRKYKYAANYGLILGGYIAVFFMLDYLMSGNALAGMLNIAGFLATPVVCFYLAKNYRDRAFGGYITFGQVWAFGVWLFFFAGLIMAAFYFLRFRLLQPDYLNVAFNQAIQMMQQMKAPQQQIDTMLATGMPSLSNIILIYLWIYILGGGFLFLFLSAMVARKPNGTNPDTTYKPYKSSNSDDNTDSGNASNSEPKA